MIKRLLVLFLLGAVGVSLACRAFLPAEWATRQTQNFHEARPRRGSMGGYSTYVSTMIVPGPDSVIGGDLA
jgi:hypothetical protein